MNAKRLFLSHRLALPMAVLAMVLVTTVGAAALEPGSQGPVTTGFTYQARLINDGGDPIDANCDFQFALWDDPAAGSQVGPLLSPTGVAVEDGLFTVALDFGAVFDGTALWLEVAVQCGGDAGYTTLAPRQALTAAPYAAYALDAQTAGLLDGYPGSYYLDATHISSGTLGTGYYSAYDDLGIEGYLDDGEGDLARNNNALQSTLNADMVDDYHATDMALAGHDHWSQAWAGTGTGLTLFGGDIGLYSSGTYYGVRAESTVSPGSAVYGVSTAAYGVHGQSGSSTGRGVFGNATSSTGTTYGVYGLSQSSSGTGVYGWTNATSGTTYGVYGQSNSTSGVGVYGWAVSSIGTTYGLYGQSDSTSGTGVYGQATAASGTTYGVYGRSDSVGGSGLYGLASAATGTNYGVYGLAEADEGYAVGTYGRSESINGRGVTGYVPSTTGDTMGVHGRSASNAGIGVHGWAENSYGMTTGTYGRSDSTDGFGVVGHNWWNGVGVGAWSYGGDLVEAYSGDWPAGTLRFYVTNNGTVYADGGYNTFRSTGSGDNAEYRTLYGMTSAEAWVEDFGRATLTDGQVTVTIDPAFAQMVSLAKEYHVYLTPICPNLVVLAVTDRQPDRFTVQGATLDGKPSGCAFDYRIVARQRGHEDERLEVVDIPEPVEVDRQDSHEPGAPEREREDGR